MFKKFNKEESSNEEENQNSHLVSDQSTGQNSHQVTEKTPTKSQGITPTKSQLSKNPFIETDEEEIATIDELLESDDEDDDKTVKHPRPVDKKEILKVSKSYSKKNSSIFNYVPEHFFHDKKLTK